MVGERLPRHDVVTLPLQYHPGRRDHWLRQRTFGRPFCLDWCCVSLGLWNYSAILLTRCKPCLHHPPRPCQSPRTYHAWTVCRPQILTCKTFCSVEQGKGSLPPLQRLECGPWNRCRYQCCSPLVGCPVRKLRICCCGAACVVQAYDLRYLPISRGTGLVQYYSSASRTLHLSCVESLSESAACWGMP